jgi:heme-degrading monooxygenase HmoA
MYIPVIGIYRRHSDAQTPLAGRPLPDGPLYVSATRFTYRSLVDMPGVFLHGLRLSIGADLLARTTYTVSAWRSETDLARWVRSPAHARLMGAYRRRMLDSRVVGWHVDRFVLRDAWTKALALFDI